MATETGDQVLSAITTIWPHLITLDLNLPSMTGDRILSELRRRDETRALPVVVVTALEPIPPQVRGLAQAIVPKPFQVDELLTVIQGLVLPPRRASDEE